MSTTDWILKPAVERADHTHFTTLSLTFRAITCSGAELWEISRINCIQTRRHHYLGVGTSAGIDLDIAGTHPQGVRSSAGTDLDIAGTHPQGVRSSAGTDSDIAGPDPQGVRSSAGTDLDIAGPDPQGVRSSAGTDLDMDASSASIPPFQQAQTRTLQA
jgi:hypothetical protein